MRSLTIFAAIFALAALSQGQTPPPDGATILFDGKDASKWESMDGKPCPWKIADGAMEAGGGDIHTKDKFEDYTLHVEFRTPMPKEGEKGQHRGNSGVYLDDRYEIQVLDSFGIETSKGDCGAIYNQKAPDKNMAKPPMEWQTYDITFSAPRFDADKKKTEKARVTVIWNGERVHDNIEIDGPTKSGAEGEEPGPGSIRLQDHGHPVQYRNIWVVPTKK